MTTPRPLPRLQLRWLAHARSGDKGNTANVGLIALEPELYPILVKEVTAARVARHFKGMVSRRGAVRAPQPQRAQLSPARRAGRRRHHLAQDRCPGQGVFDGAAADGGPGAAGDRPAVRAPLDERLLLDTARDGGILTLTLNRPDKRNALSSALVERCMDALGLGRSRRRGPGRGAERRGEGFLRRRRSGGAACFAGRSRRRRTRRPRFVWEPLFTRMRSLPKPVIAVVRGRSWPAAPD